MTNPQDEIMLTLRRAPENTLGADKVVTRVMNQGHTHQAVLDALSALVSAGLVVRGGGKLWIEED